MDFIIDFMNNIFPTLASMEPDHFRNSLLGMTTVFSFLTTITAISALIYAVIKVREMKKARVLDAYLTFENRLISPEARSNRHFIYTYENMANPSSITKTEDIEKIERVCSTFDILGVLLAEELMYRPLVFKPFYDVIIKCWKRSYDYIKFQRCENRKSPTYMRDFEYLYKEAEKYRIKKKFKEVTVYANNAVADSNRE